MHGCHTPDGKAAPIEGWASGYNPGASGYIGNNDYCAAGGGLTTSHSIPGVYRVRVNVPGDAAYPFALGRSRAVSVRVV